MIRNLMVLGLVEMIMIVYLIAFIFLVVTAMICILAVKTCWEEMAMIEKIPQ